VKSTPTPFDIAETQDALEGCRYLEYRSILNARDAGAIVLETARHGGYAGADGAEGIQYDPGVVLLDPIRVVALLRHRPRVAHDDDRQLLLYGLAYAAGTRLADEEIAEMHEILDLRRKSDHDSRRPRTHRTQFIGQGGIVAADKNELRIVEAFRDPAHRLGPVTAEHDDSRRPIRIELQLAHLDASIDIQGSVEIGSNDHPRGRMDARGGVAGCSGLRHRFRSPANQMLRLMWFNPKMRR